MSGEQQSEEAAPRHAGTAPVGGEPASPGDRASLAAATWRLDLAYEGTAYCGWARQPGERTVEGTVQQALATVLGEQVRLSVAGRTDAGVHAWAQVASFACARRDLRPERLRLSLNSVLPPDVAVTRAMPAPPGFVAREAASRTYEYRLWVSPVKPVRERAFVWQVRGPLDAALLAQAADLLPGRRDFAALTPSARLYRSCVRQVLSAAWAPAGGVAAPAPGREWVFTIRAGSFLHNMVRVAVGSMVDVAQGRMTPEEWSAVLAGGERRNAGQTAPARGLALVAVEY